MRYAARAQRAWAAACLASLALLGAAGDALVAQEPARTVQSPRERSYSYDNWPRKEDFIGLRGIADPTIPFTELRLDATSPRLRASLPLGPGSHAVHGLQLRLSRVGAPGDLIVRFSDRHGTLLGSARIDGVRVMPLFDVWYTALPEMPLTVDGDLQIELIPERTTGSDYFIIYGIQDESAASFPFAYRLLPTAVADDSFGFVRRLSVPHDDRQADVVEIGGGWKVEVASTDEVAAYAAELLASILAETPRSSHERRATIVLAQPPLPTADESFVIEVSPDAIRIEAGSARGALRAVYWIADEMLARGSRILPAGRVAKREAVHRRITAAVLPGAQRQTEITRELIYTDSLLQRMSRDGFNALWVFVNLEEIAHGSRVFPELDDPDAPVRLARLRALTKRAARYGMDVYVYLATGYGRAIPESFYEEHPELRGGHTHRLLAGAMCTSQPEVLEYQAELIRNLFTAVPALRGLLVIHDSEGFIHCGILEEARQACPRCRHTAPEDLAARLLANIRSALPAGEDKELIAWSYGRSPWVKSVIGKLPTDVVWMADFSKGGQVSREGVTHSTEDYNITVVGPAGHFAQQAPVVRAAGLTLYAKTEHGSSPEIAFVPYVPAFDRWYERAAALRREGIRGWLGNWAHQGYSESAPARLLNWMAFDPAPSREEALNRLATTFYGQAAAPHVRMAWTCVSEGMAAFPYSLGVVKMPGPLQKGVTQPFLLDSELHREWGVWRTWTNTVQWTAPWGPDIVARSLERVRAGARCAAIELAAASRSVPEQFRQAVVDELSIVKAIDASLTTVLHHIEWVELRNAMAAKTAADERRELLERLTDVASREAANVRDYCHTDSRIGFASEGGGVVRGGLWSAALVEWKRAQIERVLSGLARLE